MKPFLKALLLSTAPALLAADLPPTTQPSTQPATQPLAQSPNPIVLPDGTSPQNPGPTAPPVFHAGDGFGSGIRR